MLIDTHAHIYSEFFKDVEQVINNAKENNVEKIINCADSLDTSKEIIELSKKYNNLYPAVGIHPELVDEVKENDIEELKKLIENNKIYAIGEIGLDYYHRNDNKEEQQKLVRQMLDIAVLYNKPVIIHSRNANRDMIDILKEYNLKGVFHSFDGTIEEANEILDMGFLIGVNGIITFKNADEKRKVIKEIPMEKIILETDAPFLTPEPFRKESNESKNILYIAEKLTELKGISTKKVEEITTKNATNLFDLD